MQAISPAQVDEIISANSDLEGALLPILHQIQSTAGFIPPETVPAISKALKISRAEIQGVISFYHDFKETPQGQHQVQLCRAESCQAMGGRELDSKVRQQLGIDFGETSADGKVSLDAVYCFGNCACSPAIKVDDKLYGRVDAEMVSTVLAELVRTL